MDTLVTSVACDDGLLTETRSNKKKRRGEKKEEKRNSDKSWCPLLLLVNMVSLRAYSMVRFRCLFFSSEKQFSASFES